MSSAVFESIGIGSNYQFFYIILLRYIKFSYLCGDDGFHLLKLTYVQDEYRNWSLVKLKSTGKVDCRL